MIGKFAAATIGRQIARRSGGNGLIGAAAGIGVSILLARLGPSLGTIIAREGCRLITNRRSLISDDDNAQSAGA